MPYYYMHLSHSSIRVIFLRESVTFKYNVSFLYAPITFRYTFKYVGICYIPRHFTCHNFLILYYPFTQICLLIGEDCKGVLCPATSSIASKYPAQQIVVKFYPSKPFETLSGARCWRLRCDVYVQPLKLVLQSWPRHSTSAMSDVISVTAEYENPTVEKPSVTVAYHYVRQESR